MRLSDIGFLTAVVLTGCQQPPADPPQQSPGGSPSTEAQTATESVDTDQTQTRPAQTRPAETRLEEMRRMVAAGEADLVDVRSRDEWEAGHVEGAVFVPITELSDDVSLAERAGLKPGRPVYTYCKAGVRAKMAAALLNEAGYDARPLSEGFEDLKAAGVDTE